MIHFSINFYYYKLCLIIVAFKEDIMENIIDKTKRF